MTEQKPIRKKSRKLRIAALLFVLAVLAATAYLNSKAFEQTMRTKVVQALQQATGGRVELGSFTWRVSGWEFVAQDVTIHGLEAKDQKPFVHVDKIIVQMKLISLLGGQVGLRSVSITRPSLHVIVNPDGSSNIPQPRTKAAGGRPINDVLFDLAIDHQTLTEGTLLWNNHVVPFDLDSTNVETRMSYSVAAQRYEGTVAFHSVLSLSKPVKPLPITTELKYTIHGNLLKLESLRLNTPNSHLSATGTLADFNDPKLESDYTALLDVAELAPMLRLPELRSGKIDMHGSGKLSAADFTIQGQMTARDATYRDDIIHIVNGTLASKYLFNSKEMVFKDIVGQLLRGNIRGEVKVTDWRAASASVVNKKNTEQKGDIHLELHDLATSEIAKAFSNTYLPFDELNAVGTVKGKCDITWRGKINDTAMALAVDLTPPPAPAPEQMPLSAHFAGNLHFHSSVLDVAVLDLTSRNTHIAANGTIGSRTAAMPFNIASSDLREWEPLIKAIANGPLPIDIHGRSSFQGTLANHFTAPTIQGVLEVNNFTSHIGKTSQTAVPPAQNWDRLTAELTFSPESIVVDHATLRRASAQTTFSGHGILHNYKLRDEDEFALQATVHGAPLAEIQSVAGTGYPIQGILEASGNIRGTISNFAGTGKIALTTGNLLGEPFNNLSGDIRLDGPSAEFQNVLLSQNGATIAGNGGYNIDSHQYRFNLRSDNLNLAHIRRIQSAKLSLAGLATLVASGAGTLEHPEFNATLQMRSLIANGDPVGEFAAEASTKDGVMRVTGSSRLDVGTLSLDASVQMGQDFPVQGNLRLQSFEEDPLLALLLGNRLTGHSSVSGNVRFSGPLRQPRRLRMDAVITDLSAEVEKVGLHNEGEIRLSLADQVFSIDQFHARGDGTDLVVTGTVEATGPQRLQMHANGAANLKLFQSFNRELSSYGDTTLEMTVSGAISKPEFQGRVKIANAGVSFRDLPNGLNNINGTLTFNQDRLQIESLTAFTGGGKLDLSGFITYRNELYFDLQGKGRDIRLRYPPGISSVSDADLRFNGTTKGALLSGNILLNRFTISPQFNLASLLEKTKGASVSPMSDPILDTLRLDLHLRSAPDLRVETSMAKLSGEVDLRVHGTVLRPSLTGRVNVPEGDLYFAGTKYKLEHGEILFTNPVRIEPVLNVEASARVREYDITIGFHGTADKLSTTYRSEPPLPSGEIIALLALGRTREDAVLTSSSAQSYSDTASGAILGQALNAAINNRMQRFFSGSRVKFDPGAGGSDNNPNARLTVEQVVNNNIEITYITNLARSTQQVIQVEVHLNKRVSILAVHDENGVLSFEVKFSHRKK